MKFGLAFVVVALAPVLLVAGQANPPNRNPTSTVPVSTAATTTTDSSIPPSPTGSGACYLHVDHWHCDGESGSDAESSEEYGETLANGCIQHGTHWHCPPGVSAPCEAFLGDYDLGLHIGALFILLVASSLGVFVPVIFGNRRKASSLASNIFFALRHFGTGVILATAFIHLLMHAFVMFANECLGHLAYEAIAPAIAMAALMIIFSIDFIAIRILGNKRAVTAGAMRAPSPTSSGEGPDSPDVKGGHGHSKDSEAFGGHGHDHDFSSIDASILVASEGSARARFEVTLLEAGICFHSIMIGVTLGAQGGDGFIPTFCAIVFHQLFEGLGLGARIGRLTFLPGQAWKKWAMCITYSLITPVGIAIGMGVRNSFNLSGHATIYAIGILDSISAGILLYAGIAQLLVGDWLAGEMRTASNAKIAVGAISLFLGLFAMSLIGKWA